MKPLFPSRPSDELAAEKREGFARTETPGSKRTMSFTSAAMLSSISFDVMTVTVAGTSSALRFCRVAGDGDLFHGLLARLALWLGRCLRLLVVRLSLHRANKRYCDS